MGSPKNSTPYRSWPREADETLSDEEQRRKPPRQEQVQEREGIKGRERERGPSPSPQAVHRWRTCRQLGWQQGTRRLSPLQMHPQSSLALPSPRHAHFQQTRQPPAKSAESPMGTRGLGFFLGQPQHTHPTGRLQPGPGRPHLHPGACGVSMQHQKDPVATGGRHIDEILQDWGSPQNRIVDTWQGLPGTCVWGPGRNRADSGTLPMSPPDGVPGPTLPQGLIQAKGAFQVSPGQMSCEECPSHTPSTPQFRGDLGTQWGCDVAWRGVRKQRFLPLGPEVQPLDHLQLGSFDLGGCRDTQREQRPSPASPTPSAQGPSRGPTGWQGLFHSGGGIHLPLPGAALAAPGRSGRTGKDGHVPSSDGLLERQLRPAHGELLALGRRWKRRRC